MREKEDYRAILEALLQHFNKHWAYPSEVADFLGMDGFSTANSRKFSLLL